MNKSHYPAITVAALAAFLLLTGGIVGTKVPTFSIEDQYEKRWAHTNYKGTITLYVLSDRDGYEYSENWTKPLRERFESRIEFVPVADVREVPGFLKGYIRSRFRDEFSYSVLMDWEGTLITALDMQEGFPTFVLTDQNGVIRFRIFGSGIESQVNRLAKKIDELLAAR